jgi:hypothetical protein
VAPSQDLSPEGARGAWTEHPGQVPTARIPRGKGCIELPTGLAPAFGPKRAFSPRRVASEAALQRKEKRIRVHSNAAIAACTFLFYAHGPTRPSIPPHRDLKGRLQEGGEGEGRKTAVTGEVVQSARHRPEVVLMAPGLGP